MPNRRTYRRANLRLRKSAVALTGAAALTVLLSACNGNVNGAISDTSPTPATSNAASAPGDSATTGATTGATSGATTGGSSTAGGGQSTAKGSDATGRGTADGAGSGVDTGNGEREPVGQSCGANDITWSTRSETQAGGYILIIAKAKAGITCYLPAALPTVAFGSDGTEAGPAEQAVGKQITLSGSTTAYAGVNPKTTKGNGGKELDSIIVAVGDDDPNPVSLPVGTITVDAPIVTNWHTAPADAVPFS